MIHSFLELLVKFFLPRLVLIETVAVRLKRIIEIYVDELAIY
jgi:hypothetical protein